MSSSCFNNDLPLTALFSVCIYLYYDLWKLSYLFHRCHFGSYFPLSFVYCIPRFLSLLPLLYFFMLSCHLCDFHVRPSSFRLLCSATTNERCAYLQHILVCGLLCVYVSQCSIELWKCNYST